MTPVDQLRVWRKCPVVTARNHINFDVLNPTIIRFEMSAKGKIRLPDGGLKWVSSPENFGVYVPPIFYAAIEHSHMDQIPRIFTHAVPCPFNISLQESQIWGDPVGLQLASSSRRGCDPLLLRLHQREIYALNFCIPVFAVKIYQLFVRYHNDARHRPGIYLLAHIDCPYPGTCP